MTYAKFVCTCLGLYDGDWVDEIEDKFECNGVDHEGDILELVEAACKHKQLGNAIAAQLYAEVVERAVDEYNHVQEDDFEYYCNGSLDTSLRYKDELVTSWSELETILDKESEEIEKKGGRDD